MYATEGHAQTKSLGQELLCLFNFFDDVFKPRIKLDKSAKGEHETAWQKWDIKFQVRGPMGSEQNMILTVISEISISQSSCTTWCS